MGMDCFWDSEELELGDHFPRRLEVASLHIAIFADQQAQSWSCLADLSVDLAFMFKTCIRIVSFIYHVKSEGVRYAKGVSADVFHWSEKMSRYTPEKLQESKNVLYDLSHNIDHILGTKEDEDRLLLKIILYGVPKVIGKVPFVVETPKDFELTTLQSEKNHLRYGRFWQNYRC